VRKKGLNVSFLVSSFIVAAWYFYGSLGYYDALGLISIPLLIFCLVYIVRVFLQLLLYRLFGPKSVETGEIPDKNQGRGRAFKAI